MQVVSMPVQAMETPQDLYTELMATRLGDTIEETLARILSSWLLGHGVMPNWLGLPEAEFDLMMQTHFPGFDRAQIVNPSRLVSPQRWDEMDDLRKLLSENRTGLSLSEIWMVDILVAGCQGNDHLWEDLGLWRRSDLSKLMLENFEPLARRNDRDMKWKKFLYKQLCEAEGIYTCRAPSCEVCADYQVCFGPYAHLLNQNHW